MNPITHGKELVIDNLKVNIYPDRRQMGEAAARDAAEAMRNRIRQNGGIRMIFAAAPSQNEFLDTLSAMPDIDWSKVTAFHMDEYLGLPDDAPQGFGNFLRSRLFDKVPFHRVHCIGSNSTHSAKECERYSRLLEEQPIDIACMGIGENGHIAFNDPPDADFQDPQKVKIVRLDERSRRQQVHDGCFDRLAQVPELAITLTIPVLLSARHLFIMVPGPTKANAVRDALQGPIDAGCPASILRSHDDASLFLDAESAASLSAALRQENPRKSA